LASQLATQINTHLATHIGKQITTYVACTQQESAPSAPPDNHRTTTGSTEGQPAVHAEYWIGFAHWLESRSSTGQSQPAHN
jgi:hypothetical protein